MQEEALQEFPGAFLNVRFFEGKIGLMQQMDLFLDYLATRFGTVMTLTLRELFDEYLAESQHSNSEYRRFSMFLEHEDVVRYNRIDNLVQYTFKLSKNLLRVAHVNIVSRAGIADLFHGKKHLGDFLDLAARVGLCDAELVEACRRYTWLKFRPTLENERGELYSGDPRPYDYGEDEKRFKDLIESRWWSLGFLRLYNVYESSEKFPRAIIRFFHVLDKAMNIDVGAGDATKFLVLLSKVGFVCSQYERNLRDTKKGTRSMSKGFEVKLRKLVKGMRKVGRCSGEKSDDLSRIKMKILQSVKGVGRMSIMQKIYDMVVPAISSRDALCLALAETVTDASLCVVRANKLGSLISLGDFLLEFTQLIRTEKDIRYLTVFAASRLMRLFGVQIFEPQSCILQALPSSELTRFLLIGKVMDSALVLAEDQSKIDNALSAILSLSESALEETIYIFTHCLDFQYKAALMCPIRWLNDYRLRSSDPQGYRIFFPQFLPRNVGLLLHCKFPSDIATHVEAYFGFSHTLASFTNRIRFLRVKYKSVFEQRGDDLDRIQRIPETLFRMQACLRGDWHHPSYFKRVEKALLLFVDTLEMIGKQIHWSERSDEILSELLALNRNSLFFPLNEKRNGRYREMARMSDLQKTLAEI